MRYIIREIITLSRKKNRDFQTSGRTGGCCPIGYGNSASVITGGGIGIIRRQPRRWCHLLVSRPGDPIAGCWRVGVVGGPYKYTWLWAQRCKVHWLAEADLDDDGGTGWWCRGWRTMSQVTDSWTGSESHRISR